ncbi:MAG TPA: hypothetical protein VKV73_23855 [Chloroflexota bacterium]|nr:hypothetical protein [Chloroflexota bacterium]
MRLSVALGCLLLVGCTGPHSTGALWAQRDIEQETILYRLSDAQRVDRVRALELALADDVLAAERARITAGLSDCPGPGDSQSLAPSIGDKPRDTVRIQAGDDPARLASVAQIALADWRLRRARGTGEVHFCDQARQALAAVVSAQRSGDLLGAPGTATVTRDPSHALAGAVETWPGDTALSNYALGYVDTVQALTPLPQYLAAVYGGVLLEPPKAPPLNGATPESLVDQFAPAYPEWEPDALYAALTTTQ